MAGKCNARSAAKWCLGGLGIGAAIYGGYVAATWARYGRPRGVPDDDPLLDVFIPTYDVAIHHQIRVAAPCDVTFAAACAGDLAESAVVRGLFKVRELIFGPPATAVVVPSGTLLEQVTAIGWTVLAEVPDREVIFGTVTQPWNSQASFRPIPPEQFAAFDEPGYVKIVWTLRVDPLASGCVARTDTRVATTSADARAKFRWYWSCLVPGIKLIRVVMLSHIKRAAEEQAALDAQQAA